MMAASPRRRCVHLSSTTATAVAAVGGFGSGQLLSFALPGKLSGASASTPVNRQARTLPAVPDPDVASSRSLSQGVVSSSSAASATAALAAAGLQARAWQHHQLARRRRRAGLARRAEEAVATATTAGDMVSPFEEGGATGGDKSKLALTLENVQIVLDEVRPMLQNDGGDAKIIDIDGPIVKLELQGSCSSCSASSVTLKMGIERTLRDRIPEISEVIAVAPDQEPLSPEGVEEVLDGIRPFLSVSGGTITLKEIEAGPGKDTRVILEMAGPPLKSMAVRVEVINRIKRRFPIVQEVDIKGSADEPKSA